jgi:hypothetical protein
MRGIKFPCFAECKRSLRDLIFLFHAADESISRSPDCLVLAVSGFGTVVRGQDDP